MAIPLGLILPALVPVVADGIRAIFNRVTNGAGLHPTNVGEAVQLMEAEVKRVQALAALDAPAGNISRWVADLRASFRYIAAAFCILAGYSLVGAVAMWPDHIPVDVALRGQDAADAAFSFIFGDRMYAYMRRK